MHETASDLNRFVAAQRGVWVQVLDELSAGRKRSHWMWFIFPQMRGLGRSDMAQRFGIASMAEAEAYLAHPLLGPRLVQCTELLLALKGRSATDIFGSPDDMKLRSCLTLFAEASPPGPTRSVFQRALDQHFDGQQDTATLDLLESTRHPH